MKPRIEVKASPIQGRGVFTNHRLVPGEVVGWMEWDVVPRGAKVTRHDIKIKRRWHRITNRFRFLNHSEQPNVEVRDTGAVVAIDRIAPGTELVFDYGEGWTC